MSSPERPVEHHPGREHFLPSGAPFVLAAILGIGYLILFHTPETTWIGEVSGMANGLPILDPTLRVAPNFFTGIAWKLFLLVPAGILLAWGATRLGWDLPIFERLEKPNALSVICLWAMLFIVANVLMVLQGIPVSGAEARVLRQAEGLAFGKAGAFVPGEPFPTAHVLLLTMGMKLGLGWLIPVLAGGFVVWLTAGIGELLYGDRRLGRFSSFLLFNCPLFLFTSATYDEATTRGLFLVLALWLTLKGRILDPGWRRWAFGLGAGLAFGAAASVSVFAMIGFLLPLLVWHGRSPGYVQGAEVAEAAVFPPGFLKPGPRFPVTLVGGLLVGLLLGIACFTAIGHHLTGRMLPAVGDLSNLEAGAAWQPFIEWLQALAGMNLFLFGTPVSLVPIFFLFLCVRWRKEDRLPISLIAAVSLLRLFSIAPGVWEVGPVGYYELTIPLVILTARGFLQMLERLGEPFPLIRRFLPTLLSILLFLGYVTFYPEQIMHLKGMTSAAGVIHKRCAQVEGDAVIGLRPFPNRARVIEVLNQMHVPQGRLRFVPLEEFQRPDRVMKYDPVMGEGRLSSATEPLR